MTVHLSMSRFSCSAQVYVLLYSRVWMSLWTLICNFSQMYECPFQFKAVTIGGSCRPTQTHLAPCQSKVSTQQPSVSKYALTMVPCAPALIFLPANRTSGDVGYLVHGVHGKGLIRAVTITTKSVMALKEVKHISYGISYIFVNKNINKRSLSPGPWHSSGPSPRSCSSRTKTIASSRWPSYNLYFESWTLSILMYNDTIMVLSLTLQITRTKIKLRTKTE